MTCKVGHLLSRDCQNTGIKWPGPRSHSIVSLCFVPPVFFPLSVRAVMRRLVRLMGRFSRLKPVSGRGWWLVWARCAGLVILGPGLLVPLTPLSVRLGLLRLTPTFTRTKQGQLGRAPGASLLGRARTQQPRALHNETIPTCTTQYYGPPKISRNHISIIFFVSEIFYFRVRFFGWELPKYHPVQQLIS